MSDPGHAAATTPPVALVQGYEPRGIPLARVVFVSGVDLPGLEFGKTPRADTVIMSATETVPAARGTYQARKENAYDIVECAEGIAVRCHGGQWWALYPMHMVKMRIPGRGLPTQTRAPTLVVDQEAVNARSERMKRLWAERKAKKLAEQGE